MICEQTDMKLRRLGLDGMAEAYSGQRSGPDSATLGFDERLGLLLDSEMAERESRQNTARLKRAKLKHVAAH